MAGVLFIDLPDEDPAADARRRRRRPVYRLRINMQWPLSESFRERFRLSVDVADRLETQIGILIAHDTDKNMALTPREQLLVTLRVFATGAFFRLVADGHGPAESTVCRAVHRVTEAVLTTCAAAIRWPPAAHDVTAIQDNFRRMAGLCDVVGCIDGTHVMLSVPKAQRELYMNRKGFTSINVMAVAGPDLTFKAASVHCSGRAHDARVLATSGLPEYFRAGHPAPNALLLGDSAYALTPWLLTPIAHPQTAAEEAFNKAHNRTRVVVENAFGLLKGRFPVLHSGIRVKKVERSVAIIRACIVLHNVCMAAGDLGDWLGAEAAPAEVEAAVDAAEPAAAAAAAAPGGGVAAVERRAGNARRQHAVRLLAR